MSTQFTTQIKNNPTATPEALSLKDVFNIIAVLLMITVGTMMFMYAINPDSYSEPSVSSAASGGSKAPIVLAMAFIIVLALAMAAVNMRPFPPLGLALFTIAPGLGAFMVNASSVGPISISILLTLLFGGVIWVVLGTWLEEEPKLYSNGHFCP